ncbi:ATP synthase subunit I [Amphibacillus sp. MSJ-3]|uniref:ATP synthase subunit I n=1 Tax=Amphibacillus sp. MSJ-3 TaxID=2841505 RepID=UPI001C0EF79D|nr:ATP synthase subunit I [Amphibacillus sp. MSJ-3]MBU5595471.1 ATP synthase subunit I [Amphibacillus sp. MSJ-3]
MKLSDLAKKMVYTILIIALICILSSVIYHRSLDFLPFAFGVLLGSAVSIAKVFLLERAVNKALEMEQKHAKNYVSIQHVLRLLLSGVVLVLGAIMPQLSLWGVAAGILAFQVAVYNVKFTAKN